jgi:hypothetical protein
MGADLIGYLAKGPRTLDSALKDTAKARVAEVAVLVAELEAKLEAADVDYPTDSDDSPAELRWDPRLPAPLYDDLELAWDMLIRAVYGRLEPLDIVDDLFHVWEHGARDSHSRPDPDDPEQRLMFAGELSWGDTPEGFGYKTLDAASALGLLDLFCIR